jgi:hypothetical protein
VAHLVLPSTALAFLTNMSEKCKSTSSSAIQVKTRGKTIGIEEKLDVISRLKKVNKLLTYAVMLKLAYSSIHKIRDNADRFKESAKSGTKVFVCVARLPQSY